MYATTQYFDHIARGMFITVNNYTCVWHFVLPLVYKLTVNNTSIALCMHVTWLGNGKPKFFKSPTIKLPLLQPWTICKFSLTCLRGLIRRVFYQLVWCLLCDTMQSLYDTLSHYFDLTSHHRLRCPIRLTKFSKEQFCAKCRGRLLQRGYRGRGTWVLVAAGPACGLHEPYIVSSWIWLMRTQDDEHFQFSKIIDYAVSQCDTLLKPSSFQRF